MLFPENDGWWHCPKLGDDEVIHDFCQKWNEIILRNIPFINTPPQTRQDTFEGNNDQLAPSIGEKLGIYEDLCLERERKYYFHTQEKKMKNPHGL